MRRYGDMSGSRRAQKENRIGRDIVVATRPPRSEHGRGVHHSHTQYEPRADDSWMRLAGLASHWTRPAHPAVFESKSQGCAPGTSVVD